MATAFDGHPMVQKGRGQEAIIGACFSSAFGTLFGAACYLLLAWPMISIALKFGPSEFFWLGIFALTIIGSLAGDSMLKGLAGGAIGLLISAVGISHGNEISRFTFGVPELRGGLSLVAGLIGIFAIPQVLSMVADLRKKEFIAEYSPVRGQTLKTVMKVLAHPLHLIRSAVIGSFIGILPGAGSPIAALVSYNEAVRWSKDKSQYGKGDLRGVTASEIANNAAAPAAMIPLVTLGVPGSSPAAVIAGALMLRGLNPARNCSKAMALWSTPSAGRFWWPASSRLFWKPICASPGAHYPHPVAASGSTNYAVSGDWRLCHPKQYI